MTSPVWDPALYQQFSVHRDRAFHDLVAQVEVSAPRRVVDLGCGPGTLTATLADRWPQAQVVGVDSSPEMIERATEHRRASLDFHLEDLRTWLDSCPDDSVDVMVSNATLQWIPEHLTLMTSVARVLAPGGQVAIQVPGNHESPLHALLRARAGSPPYAEHAADATRLVVTTGQDYLEAMSAVGLDAQAWETTYLHVLQGVDPVFAWISGTGARPVLQALPPELRPRFEQEYRADLRQAYPPRPYGTVLPFRRVFAVGSLPG